MLQNKSRYEWMLDRKVHLESAEVTFFASGQFNNENFEIKLKNILSTINIANKKK